MVPKVLLGQRDLRIGGIGVSQVAANGKLFLIHHHRAVSAFRTIEFVRPAVELRRAGMGVFQHALDAVFHLHLGKGTGTGTVVRRIELPHLRVDLFGVGTGQPPERVQLVD